MNINIKHIIIFFLSLSGSFSLEAASKSVPFIFEVAAKYENVTLNNVPAQTFELQRKYSDFVFADEADSLIIENFPVAYGTFAKIILRHSNSPISSNTKFETVDVNGKKTYKPSDIIIYQGRIENQTDSKIFLTYSKAGIYAVVWHETGEIFSINPEHRSNNISQKHYLTQGDKLQSDDVPWLCYTDEYSGSMTISYDLKNLKDLPLSPGDLIDVEIACEATSEFYQLFNDIDKATAYITSVIAYASKIYEENINVRLSVSYMLIWQNSSLDPYRTELYLNEKLRLMPDLWEPSNVERSITVLFASLAAQPGGTIVAGIAYGGTPGKGNLCNKKWGYCVLGIRGGVDFPTTNYTWDVNVAAHEIGHLFGAPHTHVCAWDPPIDTCVTKDMGIRDACNNTGIVPRPGTIMSYCHLTNSTRSVQLFFHPLQKPLMRKAAEKASCNEYVKVPYISLLSPLGGTVYRAGDVIPIRWTSANINTVSIKYSADSGKHWIAVADYLDASDTIYNWTAPLITSNRVLIVVHKSTDMAINDKSWLTFGIAQPNIVVHSPKSKDSLARNSAVAISWESVFVDSLSIFFTSDGGDTWQYISTVSDVTKYEWNLPDIESNECRFKLSSADGTDIVAYSGVFSVGTPFADIISPIENDILCLGKQYTIRWNAGFVKYIYLYYSLNGGENWKKVTPVPLNAGQNEYKWNIKKGPSDSVKLRVVSKINDNEIVLAETEGYFSIRECTSSVGTESDKNEQAILLYPEPANKYLQIVFVAQIDIKVLNAKIYSLTGELIASYEDISPNGFQIDVSNFPANTYVMIVNINDTVYMKKFNVSR